MGTTYYSSAVFLQIIYTIMIVLTVFLQIYTTQKHETSSIMIRELSCIIMNE
jgi:hypothetical protein